MHQMYQHGLIAPILLLVGWTFVMWIWMYATRIPALQKLKIDPQDAARGKKIELPPEVSRVADNYNHLHEQPVVFYALALAAQAEGVIDPVNIGLAWTYVIIRIFHSLIQATVNIIVARFLVFTLGSITLLVLFVRVVMQVFGGWW